MTAELLKWFTQWVAELRLIPSSGGRFEVMADEEQIFSKKATGRHAEPGEIVRLIQQKLGIQPLPPAEK